MLEKILQYQKADVEFRNYKSEMNKTKEAQKFLQAQSYLNTVGEKLESLDKKAEELKISYHTATENLKKLSAEIKEYENLVETCEDENELLYYKKRFQEKIDSFSNLEAQANSISRDIKVIVDDFKKIGKTTMEMRVQYKENGEKVQELKNSKKAEMDEFKQKLLKLEKEVPEELISLYKSKQKDKIYPVLVQVRSDRYCGGCTTQLSLNSLQKLESDGMVECEKCRRIVYKQNLSSNKKTK